MKYIKFLFALLTLVTTVSSATPPDSLEVWLELPKSSYVKFEPVTAFLFVVNRCAQSRILPYVGNRFGQPLRLNIRRPDGSIFDRNEGNTFHDTEGRGRFAIDPGDTIVYWTEIWCDDDTPFHTGCSEPGQYALEGTYRDARELAEVRFEVREVSVGDLRQSDSLWRKYWNTFDHDFPPENWVDIMISFYDSVDAGELKRRIALDALNALSPPRPASELLFQCVRKFLIEIDDVYAWTNCITLIWTHFGPDKVVEVIRSCPQRLSDRYFRHVLRHCLQYQRRTDLYERIIARPSP